jgi:hypothetical protein
MILCCADAEQTTGVRDLHTINFLSGVSYRFGGNIEMYTFHTSLGVYFLHIYMPIPSRFISFIRLGRFMFSIFAA